MSTRRSPIQAMLATAVGGILSHDEKLVKLGLKGPALMAWLQQKDIGVPAALHEVHSLSSDAVMARVDSDEVIVESMPDEPLRQQILTALETPLPGLYRVPQQTVTFFLPREEAGCLVLAQACGVDMTSVTPETIVLTRVAGVSCGLIAHSRPKARFRLWVDYTYAPYLWGQLSQITSELP